MKLNFIASGVLCVFFSGLLHAQSVTGTIQDDSGEPIPFSTIVLLDQDSSLVKGEISNDLGKFTIKTNKTGNFRLAASSVGFEHFISDYFRLNDGQSESVGNIRLKEKTEQLEELVVSADKPIFEQKLDRTVVNVGQNLSVSGGTALDVLERSPGITVDRMNNSLALAGKQGVRVMINGKISNLPAAAVVQMLDGMNAENLEKIELITTPPAKYEAEGDAGMINIVLKKSADKGTNGFVSAFGGYGRDIKYGGNINLNHRNKGLNLFGDFSYRNNFTKQFIGSYRNIQTDTGMDVINSPSERDANTEVFNGRFGIDIPIGKTTVIGGSFSFFDRDWTMDAINNIDQNISNQATQVDMSTFEINDWYFTHGNFNVYQEIGQNHNLSVDFNRISYDANNPTEYLQEFYSAGIEPDSVEELLVSKRTPTAIYTAQIDYSGKFGDKITFEAGAKGSFNDLENDVTVDQTVQGVFVRDDELSNLAMLTENIGAGYTSLSWNVSERNSLQMGLRYEYTRTNIDTETEKSIVDRRLSNFFPSFFYNNKINDNNSWVVSYSRRVSRPRFQDIAPFIIFVDPNAFFAGNEKLLPAFTNTYRLEYRFKTILLSTSYSRDENAIARFQPKLDSRNRLIGTSENMDYRDSYSVNLSFPIGITDWWEIQSNVNASLIKVKSSYLETPVELSITNLRLNGSSRFKLSKKMKAELSWFYASPQYWGIYESKAFGSLNFGFEREIGENGSLRISMNDIFKTNTWISKADVPAENLDVKNKLDFETRVFRITYNQRFGNNKLKGKRNRKSGSDTELQRIQ